MQLSDFSIEQTIYSGNRSVVLLATRLDNGKKSIVKRMKASGDSEATRLSLYNEYDVLNQLHTAEVYSIGNEGEETVLVREYFPGATLLQHYVANPPGIIQFLELAAALTRALGDLHNCRLIHKDINPSNIIVSPDNRITFIDFEFSSWMGNQQNRLLNTELLEGTLQYIAPEQTGRMNRKVDLRSDFYSLGVTFYEMLAGRPPFRSSDPLELIHSHLARTAEPLDKVNPAVPAAVAQIVAKLMAKNAEDRYQSVEGILHDLNYCLVRLRKEQPIGEFTPGLADASSQLILSQRLYGREKELMQISGIINRAAGGSTAIVSVAGASGVGKSMLIREFYEPVTMKGGLFLTAKCDVLQQEVPFFSWVQIIEDLTSYILAQKDELVKQWRRQILAALGNNGQVLVNLVPNLQLIIGMQPTLPPLTPVEAQNRFQLTMLAFLRAVASMHHPLVVMLDDAQWADVSTIALLERIAADHQLHHLVLFLSYRKQDVGAHHPLRQALDKIAADVAAGNKVPHFEPGEMLLENLSVGDCTRLLADTLVRPAEEVAPLAEIVHTKTLGNAFFVGQFIQNLREERLLDFDPAARAWVWDSDKILRANVSDDVAELLSDKINGLPANVVEVLKAASVLGNHFGLGNLAYMLGKPVAKIHPLVWQAIQEGVLISDSPYYKYVPDIDESIQRKFEFSMVHDRVQQTVYGLLSEEERHKLHYKLGMWLLSQHRDGEEYDPFVIAQHINNALPLLANPQEQDAAMRINVQAGLKAWQHSAFNNAYNYFDIAYRLFNDSLWQTDPDFCRTLFNHLAETAYFAGHNQKMEQTVVQVLARSEAPLDRVEAQLVMLRCLAVAGRTKEATLLAREYLKEVGQVVPLKPSKFTIILEAIKAQQAFGKLKLDQLANYRKATEERAIAAMKLYDASLSSFFLADMQAYPIIAFRMVYLSAKYGNTPESAVAYATYAIIQGSMKKTKAAYDIGLQTVAFVQRENLVQYACTVAFMHNTFGRHWMEPLESTLAALDEGYHKGLQAGNVEYAGWCKYMYCYYRFSLGTPLDEVMADFENSLADKVLERNFEQTEKKGIWKCSTSWLRQAYDSHYTVPTGLQTAAEYLEERKNRNDLTGLFTYHFSRLIPAVYFGDYDFAAECSVLAAPYENSSLTTFSLPQFRFYEALSMVVSVLLGGSIVSAKNAAKKCGQAAKWFAKIAAQSPQSYGHYALLTSALHALLKKDAAAARKFFAELEEKFDGRSFRHEVGLACLLKAILPHSGLKDAERAASFAKAMHLFRSWGADALVTHLQQKYPQFTGTESRSQEADNFGDIRGVTSSSIKVANLDALTILKSTEVLTSEIVLSRLLENLLKLAIENAGAREGYFVLMQSERLTIAGAANADGYFSEPNQPVEGSGLLSEGIINYVAKTGESIVVNDAQVHPLWRNDAFCKSHQARSILCIPFAHQGKLSGIIYLANELTTGVFTDNRVMLLKVLAGQIAVSVENAILYAQMEQKVRDRTLELQREKEKSDQLLLNILPVQVAEELKDSGSTRVRFYENATVLFSDIENFTGYGEQLSPEELVAELDACFRHFDDIVHKYNLEKIKTIGDAYLCVSGIPDPDSHNPVNLVAAACEMQQYIVQMRHEREAEGKQHFFRMRVGIHSGPLVAGVVGSKKFAYDIWGDTVNTASRLESNGKVDEVNISAATYELIKQRFDCDYRGKVNVKNKGLIDMYFVKGAL